jgi:hypothetical protein
VFSAFLVVADEAYGRQIPFAFLERLRDAFLEKFADRGRTAPENSLNNSFGCVGVYVEAMFSIHIQQRQMLLVLGQAGGARPATWNCMQSTEAAGMTACMPC